MASNMKSGVRLPQVVQPAPAELGGQQWMVRHRDGDVPVAAPPQRDEGRGQRLAPLGAHRLDVRAHQRRAVHRQGRALGAQGSQQLDRHGAECRLHHASVQARQCLQHRQCVLGVGVRDLQHAVAGGGEASIQPFHQRAAARDADGAAQQQHGAAFGRARGGVIGRRGRRGRSAALPAADEIRAAPHLRIDQAAFLQRGEGALHQALRYTEAAHQLAYRRQLVAGLRVTGQFFEEALQFLQRFVHSQTIQHIAEAEERPN
jgi:hypothetical protein